jgi:pyruvate/2-oxoglutarate dehydrogenase complex dihydrolipoamide acyltransferase (E2) component
MATLDQKFEAFRAKYDLTEEATTEMLAIFNETFIELAHKLLSNQDISTNVSVKNTPAPRKYTKSTEKSSGVKKFATKIAAEYAAERGFTLDDFDKEKITKKDVDELAKNGKPNTPTPEEPEKTIPKLMTDMCKEIKNTKKKPVQKCHGVNRDGTPCDKNGEQKPDNCSNYYCFRHALDWKKYEVSSDSELEEEEEMIFKDLAISTED